MTVAVLMLVMTYVAGVTAFYTGLFLSAKPDPTSERTLIFSRGLCGGGRRLGGA
jgi:hypothetical protein